MGKTKLSRKIKKSTSRKIKNQRLTKSCPDVKKLPEVNLKLFITNIGTTPLSDHPPKVQQK